MKFAVRHRKPIRIRIGTRNIQSSDPNMIAGEKELMVGQIQCKKRIKSMQSVPRSRRISRIEIYTEVECLRYIKFKE